MKHTSSPRRHVINAREFLEMGNARIFSPGTHLELIDGELIEIPPFSSPHAAVFRELATLLSRAFGDRVLVSPQCPLVLGENSVPQPDLVLLKPSAGRYFDEHPRASDALLIIEVTDTSLHFNLEAMASRYAQAGVPELWVVDVEHRIIRVFRDPDSVGYRKSFTVAENDPVQPAALGEPAISVQALFPA